MSFVNKVEKSILGDREEKEVIRAAWLVSAAVEGRRCESGPRLEGRWWDDWLSKRKCGFWRVEKGAFCIRLLGLRNNVHRMGVSNSRPLFPQGSGGWTSSSRCQRGGSSVTWRRPSSPMSSQGHPSGCVTCSPHKNRSLAALGPTRVLSPSVLSDSLWPRGLQPTRPLCPWDAPGKDPEWVAISLPQESSQSRNRTQVSCIAVGFFTGWATREVTF